MKAWRPTYNTVHLFFRLPRKRPSWGCKLGTCSINIFWSKWVFNHTAEDTLRARSSCSLLWLVPAGPLWWMHFVSVYLESKLWQTLGHWWISCQRWVQPGSVFTADLVITRWVSSYLPFQSQPSILKKNKKMQEADVHPSHCTPVPSGASERMQVSHLALPGGSQPWKGAFHVSKIIQQNPSVSLASKSGTREKPSFIRQ